MDKNKAEQRADEINEQITALYDELERLADENGIEVSVQTRTSGWESYVPAAEGRPTVQDYWNGDYDEDDYDTSFSGWQNSSTFC